MNTANYCQTIEGSFRPNGLTTTTGGWVPTYQPTFNQGWTCPKCGRCYSPTVQMCLNCLPPYNPEPWKEDEPTNQTE